MHLKISSAKWRPFCPGEHGLRQPLTFGRMWSGPLNCLRHGSHPHGNSDDMTKYLSSIAILGFQSFWHHCTEHYNIIEMPCTKLLNDWIVKFWANDFSPNLDWKYMQFYQAIIRIHAWTYKSTHAIWYDDTLLICFHARTQTRLMYFISFREQTTI